MAHVCRSNTLGARNPQRRSNSKAGSNVGPSMRILGLVLVAVLAVLLGGCVEEPSRDYWVGDESFTAEERQAIEDGNAFLAGHTGQAPLVIVWGKIPLEGRDRMIIRAALEPKTVGRTAKPEGWCIFLDPDQIGPPLAVTAAHELGHLRGLPHLPSGVAGLMNPIVPEQMTWEASDEGLCVANRVCR